MGELYCDGQPIDAITALPYHELEYWHKWSRIKQKAYSTAMGAIPGGK